MGHKVICFGRQFGSGGHELAVRTAAVLRLHVYEKEMAGIARKFGDVAMEVLEKADERATNPFLYRTVYEGNHHIARGAPTSEVLFALQSHEIARIAQREDCIFVGRCADFVLQDTDARLLRIFVAAPFAQRVRRKMEQEHLTQGKAERLVQKMDHQRSAYYNHYAKGGWGEAAHYDLYLSMDTLTMEESTRRIVERFSSL